MRVGHHRLDPQVRELVAGRDQALDRLRLEPVLHARRIARARRRAAIEGDRAAVRGEPRLEADGGLGPVPIVPHVLLARPDQLDRLADRLADLDRLADFVGIEPAAEAAAGKRVVDVDVFRSHARSPRGELQRGIGILRADPDVDAIGLHMRRAIERLHWRVRDERRVVDRLVDLGGRRHGGIDIAVVSRHRAGLLSSASRYVVRNCALSALAASGRSHSTGELVERGLGAPIAVGDDHDRVAQLHHLHDAAASGDRRTRRRCAAGRRTPGRP